jgi:sugar phosphate isomerase/epimerase
MDRRHFLLAAAPAPLLSAAKAKLDRSRFSVMTDEVGRNLDEGIAFAKQYRLSAVELRMAGRKMYDELSPPELKETAQKLKDAGLRCSFLNAAMLKFTAPGTTAVKWEDFYENMYKDRGLTPDKMYAGRMDHLKRVLEAAQILGAPAVRTFTYWRVAEPRTVFPRLRDNLLEMADAAKKAKVQILVENEFACNMASSAETAELVGMLKSSAIGINWDPQNSVSYEGGTVFPRGYGLLPAKRIANVQIKWEGLVAPGKPHLPWGDIMRRMNEGGYTGYFGLETHTLKGPDINIPASHECLKEMLKLVGDAA